MACQVEVVVLLVKNQQAGELALPAACLTGSTCGAIVNWDCLKKGLYSFKKGS
jgi:hypothetical protein